MRNRIPVLNRRRPGNEPLQISGTIIGFMLFLSGALLLLYALLDIVVRLNSTITVVYLILGCAIYKVGQTLLNHFATFKGCDSDLFNCWFRFGSVKHCLNFLNNFCSFFNDFSRSVVFIPLQCSRFMLLSSLRFRIIAEHSL